METQKTNEMSGKTKKCVGGEYAVFSYMEVVFDKKDLIHACVKKHQHEEKYIEPRTASEAIKWAKETYRWVAEYDVVVEAMEEEFRKFENKAVASINRLFPELREEEYKNWYNNEEEDC